MELKETLTPRKLLLCINTEWIDILRRVQTENSTALKICEEVSIQKTNSWCGDEMRFRRSDNGFMSFKAHQSTKRNFIISRLVFHRVRLHQRRDIRGAGQRSVSVQ